MNRIVPKGKIPGNKKNPGPKPGIEHRKEAAYLVSSASAAAAF